MVSNRVLNLVRERGQAMKFKIRRNKKNDFSYLWEGVVNIIWGKIRIFGVQLWSHAVYQDLT